MHRIGPSHATAIILLSCVGHSGNSISKRDTRISWLIQRLYQDLNRTNLQSPHILYFNIYLSKVFWTLSKSRKKVSFPTNHCGSWVA